jgi:Predicted transcriptional regulators
MTQLHIEELSTVFGVLSNPTRLGMVLKLRNHTKLSEKELILPGVSQQATNAHLRRLLDANIVECSPAGRFRYYSLRNEQFRRLAIWADETYVSPLFAQLNEVVLSINGGVAVITRPVNHSHEQ